MSAHHTAIADRVGRLADNAAAAWGDRECVRIGDTAYTFAGMRAWSDAIAAELLDRGVGPGDRVMIVMVNRLEVIATTMAAWRIGAVATPVVAIYRTHELVDIVADTRPSAVVTTPQLGDRDLAAELDHCFAAAGLDPVRYAADGSDTGGWAPLASGSSSAGRAWPEPAGPLDECLRLYTSGSTSAPKGVRLHSTSVILGGLQFADRLGIGPTDTGLAVAPVAHIAGLLAACIVPLTCGAGAVVLPRWNVENAVDTIDRHRVTWSLGAAVFLKDLVEEYERRADPGLHVLSHYISGGASTSPDLIERADALGMWAARTYGMTEASGVVTLAPRDSAIERRARWDGKLADNAEAVVVGDDGAPLGADAEGIIRIRGSQILLGYTDPAINAEQFSDGWFDPGDRGLISTDGWMRITGRTKDIINRGGEKFSAADIENVLHRHPHVRKAAVVGVPHERLGECVCAFIEMRKGSVVTSDMLSAFMVAEDTARAKIPTEWHFVDHIPTTLSGKVQKHLLCAQRDSLTTSSASIAASKGGLHA